jgi:hypothetical protein
MREIKRGRGGDDFAQFGALLKNYIHDHKFQLRNQLEFCVVAHH